MADLGLDDCALVGIAFMGEYRCAAAELSGMNCADKRWECAGRGRYFALLYGSASSMATSYSPLCS